MTLRHCRQLQNVPLRGMRKPAKLAASQTFTCWSRRSRGRRKRSNVVLGSSAALARWLLEILWSAALALFHIGLAPLSLLQGFGGQLASV